MMFSNWYHTVPAMVISKLTTEWGFWEDSKAEYLKGNKKPLILKVFLITWVFYGVLYFSINRFNASRGEQYFYPEIGLDSHIPFIWWMIFPYVTYYFFFLFPFFVEQTEKQLTRSIIFTQITILPTLLAFLIFLVMPVEVDLRDQIITQNRAAEVSMNLLHGVDTAWNGWPSLHILHSTFITIFFLKNFPDHKRARLLVFTLYVGLALSTLFTKQHYLMDFFGGLAIAYLPWILIANKALFGEELI